MSFFVRVVLAVLGLVVAGCGGPDDAGGEASTNTSTFTPTTTTSEVQMEDQQVVQAAVSDLAARLGVTEEDIEVVAVRAVQWPDGALGCPEEGEMYTQAVVDGTQVLLGVEARIYDYHAGSDGEPFLCPSDEKDGGHDFVPPPRFDE